MSNPMCTEVNCITAVSNSSYSRSYGVIMLSMTQVTGMRITLNNSVLN